MSFPPSLRSRALAAFLAVAFVFPAPALAAREDGTESSPAVYRAKYSRLVGYIVADATTGEVLCADSAVTRARSPKPCGSTTASIVVASASGVESTRTAALPAALVVGGAALCFVGGMSLKAAITDNRGQFVSVMNKTIGGLKVAGGSLTFLQAGLGIVSAVPGSASWTGGTVAGVVGGLATLSVAVCAATATAGYGLRDRVTELGEKAKNAFVTYIYTLQQSDIQPHHPGKR